MNSAASPLIQAKEEDAKSKYTGHPQCCAQHARPGKVESDSLPKIVTDLPQWLKLERLSPCVVQILPGIRIKWPIIAWIGAEKVIPPHAATL